MTTENMSTKARELYLFTKDQFAEDLAKISPYCISPMIAVRQVVLCAMKRYLQWYCNPKFATQVHFNDEDYNTVWTPEDFKAVTETIHNEIIGGSN